MNLNRISLIAEGRRESLLPDSSVIKLAGFLLLAILCASGTRAAEASPRNIAAAGPGVKFAIADLDGDLRPDMAYVETGRSDVSLTDYWIQLQVTTARRQTILVVAPTGGLEIVARDVNGDHMPDLVLTTTGVRQPVAILLNDGHGVFSQVDPNAYPGAFDESRSKWNSLAEQALDTLGVPPQSHGSGSSAGIRLPRPRSNLDDALWSDG